MQELVSELKQPTVLLLLLAAKFAGASELLSHGTFKLFVWLCLHAEAGPRRSVGYTGQSWLKRWAERKTI